MQPEEPRSHKKPKQSARRHRQKLSYGVPSEAGLRCPGRKNLKAHLRKTTKRVRCHFCGKKRIVFKCLACGEVFCMEAPVDLPNPASATGKCFRKDGHFCWLLIHGFLSWGDCWYFGPCSSSSTILSSKFQRETIRNYLILSFSIWEV